MPVDTRFHKYMCFSFNTQQYSTVLSVTFKIVSKRFTFYIYEILNERFNIYAF